MISQLTYMLQTRKGKLVTYLNNNADDLTLEKQHQLYGAITEIDSIIKLLGDHRHKEIHNEKNPDDIVLLKPIHSKGMLRDVVDFFKDLF